VVGKAPVEIEKYLKKNAVPEEDISTLILFSVLLRKKANNCVKRDCKYKNVDAYETNAQFCRILVIPFRRSAGDIFDVYLANLKNTYKVKDNIWT
jgi:hypothetical protein